jgi:hypothetical protein
VNWLKKMFGWFERLINERGSAAIMEKRLAMKDDEIAQLKAKIHDLETSREKEKTESDEVRIHSTIEFRRGRRTGGKWMPFCPKCHMPASIDDDGLYSIGCSAGCGWASSVFKRELHGIISQLDIAPT